MIHDFILFIIFCYLINNQFKDDNYSFIHKVSLSYLTFYVILNKIIYHLNFMVFKSI